MDVTNLGSVRGNISERVDEKLGNGLDILSVQVRDVWIL